jgi:hypothetical protein
VWLRTPTVATLTQRQLNATSMLITWGAATLGTGSGPIAQVSLGNQQ